jgi:hypothetical protein
MPYFYTFFTRRTQSEAKVVFMPRSIILYVGSAVLSPKLHRKFLLIFISVHYNKVVQKFSCWSILKPFYRVLTMMYNTQNYWGFGLGPSSGF